MDPENVTRVRSSASKKLLGACQKAHRRAERERLRIQKEYEQEQERKRRLQEKEAKLREKQLKKEEEERIKEEKRLKRLEEQKKRDEEKEIERKRKEEEKRKKEEERIQKEQEKKKEEEFKTKLEEKQRAVLLGFLVKSETKKDAPTSNSTSCGPFMQFELRKDMRMAPIHRVSCDQLEMKRANLTALLKQWRSGENADSASVLGLRKFGRTDYLHELKTKQHMPLSSPSTWPVEPPDIQYEGFCSAINSPMLRRHGFRGPGGTVWLRAKLFQFVENYRPAYYGTWRRRSHIVTGRRPFVRDQLELDYTVDSDDEWEEEEPGESITQSDNEEEEEEEKEDDDEDEDDNFFVPHGYLSDDEGVAAEDDDDAAVAGAMKDTEMKMLRQRLSVVEYETAHRRGMQRLKPLILGPIWLPEPIDLPSITHTTSDSLRDLDEEKENLECVRVQGVGVGLGAEKAELQLVRSALSVYRVHVWDKIIPVAVPLEMMAVPLSSRRGVRRGLPEEALPYFIHLVHNSPLGKAKLAFEFRVFWHQRTTGKLPDCTRYGEFKRCNAHTLSSGAVRKGPILSGPQWDSLALSQNAVISKLAEIAVFEDSRWSVHPDVIRRFSQQLNASCGLSGCSRLRPDMDDASISSFVFPAWQYLSDVANVTLRSNRLSAAKRRSLEIPAKEIELDLPVVVDTTVSDTKLSSDLPRVVLHSINIADLPDHSAVSDRIGNDKVPVDCSSPATDKENSENEHPTTRAQGYSVSDPSPSTAGGTPSRKRLTLDNFFTPSSKRLHHLPVTPTTNEVEFIVIDSD
ncbi:Chromatin assembly factor 1 subunit A-A [Fasciola gigantica]|uniref:Chromatin assembly factor 1 subunit A-A n=1 Tax=Fasciola gigantica TaxID=46835 RepID=A0A504ZAX7_FASGI|nr:Chromatin assembly factor 1 subunit A-A [Fasciola gigantica]